MIVDAHVHLLPERLAAKIRRFFEDRGRARMPYPYAPEAARRHRRRGDRPVLEPPVCSPRRRRRPL